MKLDMYYISLFIKEKKTYLQRVLIFDPRKTVSNAKF